MAATGFSWRNLTVQSKKKLPVLGESGKYCRRIVLERNCGYVKSGQLLAIMGPSGGGKTTLLNTLMLEEVRGVKKTSGEITLNGSPATSASMSLISKYVRQDDLFLAYLTVREHLQYQAGLRVREERDRKSRIDSLIADLDLTKCADTIIGCAEKSQGLSGGERKRLALASELLSRPSLLFCDEPTSGLDSAMAASVVSVLQTLATKGMAIIITIHQPSSDVFRKLPRFMLLTSRIAFEGTFEESISFFSSIGFSCPERFNPADHYLRLLSVRVMDYEFCLDRICDAFENSELQTKLSNEIQVLRELRPTAWPDSYQAPWCQQFQVLVSRNWASISRNTDLIVVRLVLQVMAGFILGALFYRQVPDQKGVRNISAALFLLVAHITFSTNYPAITIFCNEVPLMLREYTAGLYGLDVYFFAKQISDTPLFLVISLLFTIIFYWLVGLNPTAVPFFLCLLMIALLTLTVHGFAQMISCLASNTAMALAIAQPLLTPFLIFGGYLLNKDSVPKWIGWLRYLTWFYYSNEILTINQWEGVQLQCDNSISQQIKCITTTKEVYGTYGADPANWMRSWLMMVALILGFRMVALFCLLLRHKKIC